ncbi:MAG TPA: riboflavin biosynthesis protein RibF [Phycisphaerae bacterium]|nr:riboflavin biosynthesis protein RibF [Phycisphaerae bacterium]
MSVPVHQGFDRFTPPAAGVALTIGNFDGVHLGHQCLVAQAAQAAAARGALPAVLTFEPHPATVLAPHRAPPRLTTPAEKAALLGRAGIGAVIVLRSNPELFAAGPLEFLERVVRRCRAVHLVEGESFHFGKGRAGSVATLREHAERLGYGLTIVSPVACEQLPGNPTISSSAIREALQVGRVRDAGAMLGRPYRIVGVVGHGEGRGAELGFPTANLERVPQLVPGYAVYAAIAELSDGSRHGAVVNMGPQPTFGQQEARIEAHLLGFSGDLRGRRLALHLIDALRNQRRFPGPTELVAQLHEDVARGREVLRTGPTDPPRIPLE